MRMGRNVLTTDVPEITYENVIDVLRDVFPDHLQNASRIQRLLDFDAGNQPIIRKNPKTYRPDIDCECTDNVAHQASEFWTGFAWGNPISLVQNSDSKEQFVADGITELNKQYDLAKIKTKTQDIGRYVTIGAICNVFVDVNMDWKPNRPYFTYDVLDPRTSFVVKSSLYPDKRPMMGVTYRHDRRNGNNYYTCITEDYRFEIVNLHEISNGDWKVKEAWQHRQRSGELNPLGVVPIIEYFRSYDRMGVWEHQESELNNLNLLISDFTNDVEQNTQAVWHVNDVEFPEEQEIVTAEDGTQTVKKKVRKPKSGEWLQTYTSQDGKTPIIESLAINYDYTGMLNNIEYRRNKILEKCNVPLTNEGASNITGVAASNASGWDHAEAAATKLQMIVECCKMDELEVVLAAIDHSPYVPQDSPLRQISLTDIEVNIKRQKLYELSTKVNSIATLISKGFDGGKVLNAIPVFDDPNEVWQASKDMVTKIQESAISTNNSTDGSENSDRIMQDLSDQVSNSPLIDNSRTEK
jgi:SPP1 family phage portal protein